MRNPLASGFVGPLAPYANAIAEQLSGQGYAPWTVQNKLHVVAKLSRWLAEHHLPVGVLNEQQAWIFLHEFHGQERRRYQGDPTTLRGLLKQLSAQGVIPEPIATAEEEGAQAQIIQEYAYPVNSGIHYM
jgi:hypothetical protein